MTHAAKGQYDTNRLEFHRIKMCHWQWHALRVLSSSMEAESGGCLVLRRGQGLHTCSRKSHKNGAAGAEPSLVVHPDDSTAGGRGITWAQVRGHHWAEASTWQSTSVRTEAHLTRKSSEVAHGVLSRIIKKKRSYFSHYFWKYCMSKLKSKVHLRVIGGDTHTHLHIHTHTHHSSLKVKWFINKNPSCIGVFSSTGIFPHCEGFQSGPYLIRHSRQYKENNVKKKSRANPS